MNKAILVLEDGTYYTGTSFGRKGEAFGEVVFNTCMTGYQEVLTDPSYKGQMVTMTYPLIGNYGYNEEDLESEGPKAEGFIVKEICSNPSNFRLKYSAEEYFEKHNVLGIKDIDTRALTKHIRKFGSMYGLISTNTGHVDLLVNKIKEYKKKKVNLVKEVSTEKTFVVPGKGKRVVIYDFGCKTNIIRHLEKYDCEMYVVPYDTNYEKILDLNPDGIMISNGPGDPADLDIAVENIKKLIGKKPLYGICLGLQLLGIAFGGKTYKMKFGHHGGNHAIKDLRDNKCYITSQNHNYAMKMNFSDEVDITEINVNDKTVEGFKHKKFNIRAVQYHPEAFPGPYDSHHFFKEFVDSI